MRERLENLIAVAQDENRVEKCVAEMGPSDYEELMRLIDEVMELNDGEGPDPIRDKGKIEWLKCTAIIAENYEKQNFKALD